MRLLMRLRGSDRLRRMRGDEGKINVGCVVLAVAFAAFLFFLYLIAFHHLFSSLNTGQ